MTNIKQLSPRLLKCLKRIEAKKSLPDFGGVCILESKGYITMTGPSDDIDMQITEKGREALKDTPK